MMRKHVKEKPLFTVITEKLKLRNQSANRICAKFFREFVFEEKFRERENRLLIEDSAIRLD